MKKIILMASIAAFALFGLTACCSNSCDTACPKAKNCPAAAQSCPANAKSCPMAKDCPMAKECPKAAENK